METSGKTLTTAVSILLFIFLVVGGPYSTFIYRACHPAGITEFFDAIGAFHSREGC